MCEKQCQKEKLYGWYSDEADKLYGHSVYEKPDGTEVVVTAVYRDPDAESYKWDDKVFVGEVVKCLRTNRKKGLRSVLPLRDFPVLKEPRIC